MKSVTAPTFSGVVLRTFLLLAASSTRLAGMDFTVRMESDDDTTATSYFSPKAVRVTSSEGDDVIVRLDTGRFIYLDHEGRTYSEITFDQLREMTSQLAGDDAADGQRHQEAMRRMGLESGPAKLTRLGSGETIAGYATEKYLIETSSIQMEISAAPDLEIPAAYYEAFSPRGDNAPGPMGDMGKVFEEIKKIRGMILKQVSTFAFMGENTVTTTIATSVEKGAIPASTFEVPVGYKAVPLEN